MNYKWCAVQSCTNTSIKTPKKVFVTLPKERKVRHKWMQLARRNPTDISDKSTAYFCEDHFCMEKDIANYCQYKMGFSRKLIVAKGAMPSKFNFPPNRKRRKSYKTSSMPVKQKRTEQEESQAIESGPAVVIASIKTESPPIIEQCSSTETSSTVWPAFIKQENTEMLDETEETEVVVKLERQEESQEIENGPEIVIARVKTESPPIIEQCSSTETSSTVWPAFIKQEITEMLDETEETEVVVKLERQEESQEIESGPEIVIARVKTESPPMIEQCTSTETSSTVWPEFIKQEKTDMLDETEKTELISTMERQEASQAIESGTTFVIASIKTGLSRNTKYIPESQIETQCDDMNKLTYLTGFERNFLCTPIYSQAYDVWEPNHKGKANEVKERNVQATEDSSTSMKTMMKNNELLDIRGCKYFGHFVSNELLRFDIYERYGIMQKIIELLKKK